MKMKKFLPAFVATVFMTSTVFTTTASAIIAEASTPRIYVDIVYESDTQIRADVIFKNVPPTWSGGFHLNVADGWEVDNLFGLVSIDKYDGCTGQDFVISGTIVDENVVGISYANSKGTFDIDANGRFCSFKLSKTDSYSETNADISVYFTGNGVLNDCISSHFLNGKDTDYFVVGSGEKIELPKIEKVNEYIIGDANGDVYVSAKDASAILSAIYINGDQPIRVSSIESNFTRLFPSAQAPAAPDANNDGYISDLDAELVLHHYSSVSSGGGYVGAIGSKAIYEYYSN